jgi:hypothetical protein
MVAWWGGWLGRVGRAKISRSYAVRLERTGVGRAEG